MIGDVGAIVGVLAGVQVDALALAVGLLHLDERRAPGPHTDVVHTSRGRAALDVPTAAGEAHGGARREEVDGGFAHAVVHLPEWGEVVENPAGTPMGGHHEVGALHHEIVHGDNGEI